MVARGEGQCKENACHYGQGFPTPDTPTDDFSYPRTRDTFTPGTKLDSDEMRITFVGTGFPPARCAQQMMRVFVEAGDAMGEADPFVFDCGAGVVANYNAMGISFGRMDKVFISHLHGDHMSDLCAISFLPSRCLDRTGADLLERRQSLGGKNKGLFGKGVAWVLPFGKGESEGI